MMSATSDARATRTGSYSAWLKKMKGDGARAKWLSSSTNRYFTIDFDQQIFFYRHSESSKKISQTLNFTEFQGAERMPPPTNSKKKGQCHGFVLRTHGRDFELYTSTGPDAAQWVFALNAGRDLAEAKASEGATSSSTRPTAALAASPPAPERAGPGPGLAGGPAGPAAACKPNGPKPWEPRAATPTDGPDPGSQPAAFQQPFPTVGARQLPPMMGPPRDLPPSKVPPHMAASMSSTASTAALSSSMNSTAGSAVSGEPVAGLQHPPPADDDMDPFAALDALQDSLPALGVQQTAAFDQFVQAAASRATSQPSAQVPARAPVPVPGVPTAFPATHAMPPAPAPGPAIVPAVETALGPQRAQAPCAPVQFPAGPSPCPSAPCAGRQPQEPAAYRKPAAVAQAPSRAALSFDSDGEEKPKDPAACAPPPPVVIARRPASPANAPCPQVSTPAQQDAISAPSLGPVLCAEASAQQLPGPIPASANLAVPSPSPAAPQQPDERKSLGFESDEEEMTSGASSRTSRNSRVRFAEGPVEMHRPTDDHNDDGSDWDSDGESRPAAPAQRGQVRRRPSHSQAAEEDSDWDEEEEEESLAAAGMQASGWNDSDEEVAAPAAPKRKAVSNMPGSADACGARQPQGSAFVAARPGAKNAAAPAPVPSGNDDLDDLVGMLTAPEATAAPFRGSSSHSFVPGLQCMGCDFQVLRVDGFIWADDASYMFFRNNYPNVMKLRMKFQRQDGCSAYCCQCSWKSADAAADISDVAEGLKWRQVA